MAKPPLDVAVIGAGLSGLAAAHLLAKKNLTVEVFEASAQLGGRVRSIASGDRVLELGGQLVGARHRHVHALCRALRVEIVPSGLERATTRWITTETRKRGRLPPLHREEILPVLAALRTLRRYALRVPPEAPWEAPDAAAFDSRSFSSWVQSRGLGLNAEELLEGLVAGFAMEPTAELSLLQVLWWIAGSGGLLSARSEALGFVFPRGAQLLASRLAEAPFPVRRERPVHCLEQRKRAVVLTFLDGAVDAAERVIITAPFPALARMVFMPDVPEPLRRLATEVRFARGVKTALTCEAPSNVGLVLDAPARTLGGAVGRTVFATSPGVESSIGSDEERVTRTAERFGIPRAAVQDAHVQRWADEPFIGGTAALFRPGQLTALGPMLRSRFGRVHFAGAERSSRPQAMEGALESGFHVASEVAASLGVDLPCPGCGFCASPEDEATEPAFAEG